MARSNNALRSDGGIYNSRYIFPVVQYTFFGDWQVLAGYLKVWPDKADGAVIQCNAADEAEYGCNATAESDEIGWEVDFAFKTKIHNHVHFAVEGAYAEVTDRINLNSASGLHSDGKFTTIQTRFAYNFNVRTKIFWLVKKTKIKISIETKKDIVRYDDSKYVVFFMVVLCTGLGGCSRGFATGLQSVIRRTENVRF